MTNLTTAPATVDERPSVPGTPTQIANPRRATLRTTVAALVGLVLVLNPVLVALVEILRELPEGLSVPPVVFAVLNGAILLVAAVVGGVTRIMAIPAVNAWIVSYLPALAAIRPVE